MRSKLQIYHCSTICGPTYRHAQINRDDTLCRITLQQWRRSPEEQTSKLRLSIQRAYRLNAIRLIDHCFIIQTINRP